MLRKNKRKVIKKTKEETEKFNKYDLKFINSLKYMFTALINLLVSPQNDLLENVMTVRKIWNINYLLANLY